jgi:hypothetical protein
LDRILIEVDRLPSHTRRRSRNPSETLHPH